MNHHHNLAIPVLTNISHACTPFLATFLIVHLAPPVLANFPGGPSLASQTMLLGREYYQTPFGETFLLFAPLTIHAFSSIAKRLLVYSLPRSHPTTPRPLLTLLSLSAYPLLFFLLPQHIHTHRLAPTCPSAPIYSVGPSELEFTAFVNTALRTAPARTWALYTALAACAVLHAVEGCSLIGRRWVRGWPCRGVGRRTARRVLALGGVVIPVLSGLCVLWSDSPLSVLPSLSARYAAALSRSFVYRF